MPVQVYRCSVHGEFDVHLRFEDDVPETVRCQRTNTQVIGATYPPIVKARKCNEESVHVIKVPAVITVERDWNEKANDLQRDPYTQAKAQLESVYHHDKDQGLDVAPPAEESIQVAARQIEASKRPRPSAEQRHVARARKAARERRKAE